MTDTEKDIGQLREALSHSELLPSQTRNVRTLLGAYDARGREIEALKESVDHNECHVTQARIEKQLDAIRAWIEGAYHLPNCTASYQQMPHERESHCTCGRDEALKVSKP